MRKKSKTQVLNALMLNLSNHYLSHTDLEKILSKTTLDISCTKNNLYLLYLAMSQESMYENKFLDPDDRWQQFFKMQF